MVEEPLEKPTMNKKIKFILIGLIGVSIVFCLLFFQASGAKQKLLFERDSLRKTNTELSGKLEKFQKDISGYSNKVGSLNKDLEKLAKDKQQLESKYEVINREREELVEKIKKLQSMKVVAPVVRVEPQSESKVEVKPREIEISDDYWAGILRDKKALEIKLEDTAKDIRILKSQNQSLKEEKTALEFELKDLKRDSEELLGKVEKNQRLASSISNDLVAMRREQQKFDRIKEENSTLRKENKFLTQYLKKLTGRKVALEEKFKELRDDKAEMEEKVASLQVDLVDELQGATKQRPVLRRESSVELPPIVVRPKSTGERLKLKAVEVVAVNTQNNFVVVSAGEVDGLRIGDYFRVLREKKLIADIEVIQIRKNIAACDIKSLSSPIKIGDSVE
ncbi:MAG: hypothetical protein ABIH19_04020 [Candidatus Omnitrophota bacterium]